MDVICEAVTNAIHANANKIICRLSTDQAVLKTEEGEIAPRKVIAIDVEDNGDGFTDSNYKSFGQYRTAHKVSLGCKGVGRFVFLKLFERVSYTSWIAAINQKRSFPFTYDFESDNLKEESADLVVNKTILSLSGVTSHYLNKDNNIDRRLTINLSEIRERVLAHLIPTLYFYKKKKVNIDVSFIDNGTEEQVSISADDVPDFGSKAFEIKGTDSRVNSFTLSYKISADLKGALKAYHCANKRTVSEFSDVDLKISLPNKLAGYFLLESDYLDSHINNQRNEFEIFPHKTDAFSTLSWEMINSELKKIISTIVIGCIPGAVGINKDKIAQIVDERPYLADYIDADDIDIAGFVDKGQIIKKAKRRFDEAKEKLLSHANKSEYTDQDLQDAIKITQTELVAYIKDRVIVIDRLKTMIDDNESSEKLIHNLFMERYTDDDYFCVGNNNLWLLDDRFTNYSYAASEKRINELLMKMNLEEGVDNESDRPDLALFYSHNPEDKNALKSVLVELKPFKDDGKSDRDKIAGIQQLLDYIRAFQSKESIKEIWAYLVTDVDDKFEERLRINEFTPLFSTGRSIYYRYYDTIKAFIYVFGVKTLISDAEARNKVFIDIINKTGRIKELLG